MAYNKDNAAHRVILKDEITNDPEGVCYAAVIDQTDKLLKLLNKEANNPQALDVVAVPFSELAVIDALDEIVQAEYNTLSAFEKVKIDAIINCGVSNPDLSFGHVRKLFRNAFGTASTTWANVLADRERHASRAEILFGRDVNIAREDWFAARDK